MSLRPISGVVIEGFIPSVPCCVIVISLQGPTSTDEVRPYLSITRGPVCWGHLKQGIPNPQTFKLERLLDEEEPK